MKRKLTLFLSAVMAASSLPMTAYAANFKDINDVPWSGASAVINSVADRGLLSGYDDGTFRARNNVTYCEAMQMVYTTLTKTGQASFDAVTVYSYMSVLDTYKVPKWAQMAVAYGLSEGILDMQMVVTNFAGGTKAATREDVAMIFGNAVGKVHGKEKDTSAAAKFVDYWSISANAVEQISLLKTKGIISGDEYNRFNPKKNINRAEMAVMLNKTYEALADGVSETATITEVDANKGADGTVYYYIEVKTNQGYKEMFSVADGQIPVYEGNTSKTIGLSRLSEGDEVVILYSGKDLKAIRQMNAVSNQEKYDVTGYIFSIKDNVLTLENENTGETDKYNLTSGTECYVDGVAVNRKDLSDIMDKHNKDYAYAGLLTEVKREKNSGVYENVTYVDELHISFLQEYTVSGEATKLNDKNIVVNMSGTTAEKTFVYADGCTFYKDGEKIAFKDVKQMAADGTVYVKVTADANDRATSVEVSEDSFVSVKEAEESKTYRLASLSDKKMVLEDDDEKITYEFNHKNPLENIQFYTWDDEYTDWDDVDYEDAETYSKADKYRDENSNLQDVKDIYVKIGFNKGEKLSEVYLSAVKNAWKKSTKHESERKGTVVSLEDDILKFKGSSVEYKMLKSYSGSDLRNESAKTASKTMLERMANDSNMELYAEITANGDNEVVKINAYLKAAEGRLIEFNPSERYIEIETKDNDSIKINCQRKPRLTDAVEDEFEIEDLEGKNSRYIGRTVTLGFSSNGVVNEVTVGGGARDKVEVQDKVEGIAIAADNGLQFKGDDTVYRWNSKKSAITVRNYSTKTDSIDMIKRMIEDPDVEVYIIATLEESETLSAYVDEIKVYVKSAEGTLVDIDGTVQIKTDKGNNFAFYKQNKLDTCDVNGYGQEDVEERGKGVGTYVELTFDKNGNVCSVEG